MQLATPLTFRPLLKRALWGGRRLGELLGKQLGGETDYAESWEIVDHGKDQSVVEAGPWSGRTLDELLHEQGRELLGRHHSQPRFPLLFKFLDCRDKLERGDSRVRSLAGRLRCPAVPRPCPRLCRCWRARRN